MKKIIISKKYTKNTKIFKLLKSKPKILFLFSFIIIGLIIGLIFSKNANQTLLANLDFVFSSNFKEKINNPIFGNFITSLSSYFLFIIIIFLLGLTLWGFLILPFVLLIKGFGTGICIGYLCTKHGLSGFLFFSLTLSITNLISFIIFTIFVYEASNFSKNLFLNYFPSKSKKMIHSFSTKTFLTRTGLILSIMTINSLLDVIFTNLFSKFFVNIY